MSMSCSITSTVIAGSRRLMRPAMSWDSAGERPAVGSPEIRLKSVVLPAPLGPMSARRSPARTARATSSTARRPPNALETDRSSSAYASASARLVTDLAVRAWRVVARVERLLQVLVGFVLPELAHGREGRDHGVLQLTADLLHPADVDVLDGVAPAVDADRATRKVLQLHPAERREERLAVLDPAADRLHGLDDPPRVGVAGLGVVGGDLAGLGLEGPRELLVGRVVERRRVVERGHDAEGLVAHLWQHRLVRRRAVPEQRHPTLEAGRLVLLHELQRRASEEDRED